VVEAAAVEAEVEVAEVEVAAAEGEVAEVAEEVAAEEEEEEAAEAVAAEEVEAEAAEEVEVEAEAEAEAKPRAAQVEVYSTGRVVSVREGRAWLGAPPGVQMAEQASRAQTFAVWGRVAPSACRSGPGWVERRSCAPRRGARQWPLSGRGSSARRRAAPGSRWSPRSQATRALREPR
jgi:hypothetical protein